MIYRFDQFELDEGRYELRRGEEVLSLPPKCFDLLRCLLRSAGRVVSKRELFMEVWPGEHVSDSVLPVNIRTIRRVLGETDAGKIIRTARSRGYTIGCPVETIARGRGRAVEGRLVPRALVGRGASLEALKAEFAAAKQGRGAAVLLYGGPGIGKTRLLQEFVRGLRESQPDVFILDARCEAEPGAPPFWALSRLARAAERELEREPLRSAPRADERSCKRIRERLGPLLGGDLACAPADDATRFRWLRATLDAVEELGRSFVLVFVVDDLHAMDESSLRVWEALARGSRERRLLLIGAYRDDELDLEHPLSRTLGAVATEPSLKQMPLSPLSADAVAQLVAEEGVLRATPALVQELLERTQGNPYFVRELLRGLIAQGAPESAGGAELDRVELSPGARELVRRRLGRVSAECARVLSWAAVIGRQFSIPLLEKVSGVPRTALLERLCEGAAAGIIGSERVPGSGTQLPLGDYRFADALIHDATYARCPSPERALMHRQVGEALEQLHGALSDERLPELAQHFLYAAPAGDVDRAMEYGMRAAQRASAAGAYEDAVRYLEHALRAERLRSPQDPLRCCEGGLALADALTQAGRFTEAAQGYFRAAESARVVLRADLLARAALGLMLPLPLIWPRFAFELAKPAGEGASHKAAVLALADEALLALGDEHEALQARLGALRSRVESARQRLTPAHSLSERATLLARRSEDSRALFDALAARRALLQLPQDAAAAARIAAEMVALADPPSPSPRLFAAYAASIPAQIALGELETADAQLRVLGEVANATRLPGQEYLVRRLQLARALGDGRVAASRAFLDRVVALGREIGDPDLRRYQLIRAWIAIADGRSARARAELEAVSDADRIGRSPLHVPLSEFFADAGDRQRSARHFEKAAERDFEDLARNDDTLWQLCTAGDVCVRLRDTTRAKLLYDRIVPHAHLNVTSSLFNYLGSGGLVAGRLAWLLGDLAAARQHLEAALEFNRKIASCGALIVTQHVYGKLLQSGTPAERERGRILTETAVRTARTTELKSLYRRWSEANQGG